MHLRGGVYMIVYTFQHPIVLGQIIKEEKLRCAPKYWDEDMVKYYEWMYDQYKQRIGSYEKSLVWVWEKIPDFYFEQDEDEEWIVERDEPYRYRVLLVLDIPQERILWSDYDAWHVPLNDGQILTKVEELEEAQGKKFDETHGWEYVFDLEWLMENEWSGEITKQGVFDVVDISAIQEIRYYDCKKKQFMDASVIRIQE